MFPYTTLTIENWKSEFRRLELCYRRLTDTKSAEARAIVDQMNAVTQIIQEFKACLDNTALQSG